MKEETLPPSTYKDRMQILRLKSSGNTCRTKIFFEITERDKSSGKPKKRLDKITVQIIFSNHYYRIIGIKCRACSCLILLSVIVLPSYFSAPSECLSDRPTVTFIQGVEKVDYTRYKKRICRVGIPTKKGRKFTKFPSFYCGTDHNRFSQ